MGIHMLGAAILQSPDFKIEAAEAKQLAEAIQEVNKHYPIPVLTEKQEAWLNLIVVGGSIYVPRIIATKIRAKKKAAEKPAPVTVEGVYATPAAPGATPPRPN